MKLDPSKIPIVAAAYEGEVISVAIDGQEIPKSDYTVNWPMITLIDGREFSLQDLADN